MCNRTFRISDDFISEQKKLFLLLKITMPLLVLGMCNFDPVRGQIADNGIVIIFIVTSVILETIIITQAGIMSEMIKRRKVSLTDETIIFEVNKKFNKIEYSSIIGVTVSKNTEDKVIEIKIKTSGVGMHLFGFEDMNIIKEDIESKIESNKMQIKKFNEVYSSPSAVLGVLIVTALYFFLDQKYGGTALYELGNAFFHTIVGCVFLFFKPLSKKYAKQFRKFEVIFGSILFFSGIFVIILKLM